MAKDDYEVGYGKPPKKHQFKPGQSGNSKGRPKGVKNLKTELLDELHEKVSIKEGGTAKTVSKQRAMLKALLAKAVQGDIKAANTLFNMLLKLVPQNEDETDGHEMTKTDLQVLEDFKAEVLSKASKTEAS